MDIRDVNLCSYTALLRVIKSVKVGWRVHTECTGEIKNHTKFRPDKQYHTSTRLEGVISLRKYHSYLYLSSLINEEFLGTGRRPRLDLPCRSQSPASS
jgi:hypothetical protein